MEELEVIGNFGKCIIDDCNNHLHDLKDLEYQFFLSDPPYNEGCAKVIGRGYNGQREDVKEDYDDLVPEGDYLNWCVKWFIEIERICEKGLFTCGRKHLGWWNTAFGLDYGAIVYPNASGSTKFAQFKSFEPFVVFGKFTGALLHSDVIEVTKLSGFSRLAKERQEKYRLVHPHAKPPKLYSYILEYVRPESVLDIFLGSGRSARVCEAMGIRWLGFEKESKYIPDIEHHIKLGIKEHAKIKSKGSFDLWEK